MSETHRINDVFGLNFDQKHPELQLIANRVVLEEMASRARFNKLLPRKLRARLLPRRRSLRGYTGTSSTAAEVPTGEELQAVGNARLKGLTGSEQLFFIVKAKNLSNRSSTYILRLYK